MLSRKLGLGSVPVTVETVLEVLVSTGEASGQIDTLSAESVLLTFVSEAPFPVSQQHS